MKTSKTGFSKSLPHPTLHADDGNNGNLGANLKMCQTKMSRGQKAKRRRRHRRKTKAVTIAVAAVAAASAAAEKAAEVATVPTGPECSNVTIEAKTSEPRPDGGNTGIPDGPDAADVGLKVRRRKASRLRLQPSRLRRIAARAAARAAATSSPKTKEPDPKNIN